MKTARLATLSAFSIMLSCLLACDREVRPSNIMSADSMALFMEEACVTEAFFSVVSDHRTDTLQPEMIAAYDTLLDKYHLTEADMDSNLNWYVHHPVLYHQICDTVVARISRRVDSL